jgi:hypothetical protein
MGYLEREMETGGQELKNGMHDTGYVVRNP